MNEFHAPSYTYMAEEIDDPYLYARSIVNMLQRHDIIGAFVVQDRFMPTYAMQMIMAELCEINCVQPEAVWRTALRPQA